LYAIGVKAFLGGTTNEIGYSTRRIGLGKNCHVIVFLNYKRGRIYVFRRSLQLKIRRFWKTIGV
jgi:hypothetical protein